MRTYLGIDIGGTKIAGAVIDETGAVLRNDRVSTPAHNGGKAILTAALALAEKLSASREGANISAIGVGAGGQIDPDRGVVATATGVLPGWQGIDIRRAYEERFHLPVWVDNDVNALAVGELHFGAAKGRRNAVFVALGTGVGGALILDGRIYHGAHWSGGELGHLLLTMDPDARQDLGGARGTLEAYCSGPGLALTWRELTADYENSADGRVIAAMAAEDQESPAALAVKKTGEYLGFGLASIVNIFDPEIVVVGGGLASLGDMLLDPARNILAANVLPGLSRCPISQASLGANATVIGAASLCMYRRRII